ncbi:hypothetical protein PG994_014340 [Apiospora phragmitis]|uniref:Uncharacterized protein n=1 Tax=Apiospora phragmitis TaxID=2905665 RepID=A0ABR1T416_9PEZI
MICNPPLPSIPGETSRSDPSPYSTLEVSYPDAQEKTVVPLANEKIPDTSNDSSPRTFGPNNGQSSLEAVPEDTDDAESIARRKRTRCGLSPVTFWALVTALALLVLGAIGGSIAAATDSWNQQRRTVFYQRNGKLWLSQSDVASAPWTDLDIESRLSPSAASEEAVVLKPKKGTPLAAIIAPGLEAGTSGEGSVVIYLYYLDSGNNIRDIHTTTTTSSHDTASSTWAPGDL